MRARSLTLAALGAVVLLGSALPAFADADDWRHREWREHQWREHHEWRPSYYAPPAAYYAPPPAYYAPPPAYRYYAPPPVYPGPGVSFGFTVR
jgi:hypothetical protein